MNITKYETPKISVDYISDISGKSLRVNFHLRSYSNDADPLKWKRLSLLLSFYNEFDVCQFYEHIKFSYPEKVDIIKWVSKVTQLFVQKKKNNDLEILLGDIDIRVRGIAGITNATLIEFIINLKGYLSWGADRLLVYRFHHGKGKDEGFSYAFLVECRHLIYNYSFWCVFPDFVGMRGGTSYGGYKEVESILKDTQKKLDMTIIDVYSSQKKFLNFLLEKQTNSLPEWDVLNGIIDEGIKSKEKGDAKKTQDLEILESMMGETSKNIVDRSCKSDRYSINHPPGDIENRVFIGGDYRHPSVLREIKKIVSSLGFQPIIALDFDIPPRDINRCSKMLLHVSNYAIFEVSSSSGQLMELERTKDYDVETLVVFQVIDEKEKPKISQMISTFKVQKVGYKNFNDLKKHVSTFLLNS